MEYSGEQVMRLLNITESRLTMLERKKALVPYRNGNNRKIYTDELLENFRENYSLNGNPFVYCLVSADKYSFIVDIYNTRMEIAKDFGVDLSTIHRCLNYHQKFQKKFRIEKVSLVENEN